MLEPAEVDEGYFTPVASTTLANIFKSDSGIDDSVNASLKYKPPQPKKTEPTPKPDDPNASHCVFSCSLYAYEWLQGAHKFKGKVGFAIMKINNTGTCKIILYNPDKSTLSCTTMSSELQVTFNGAMITLFDDHKTYWGLCLNDSIIDKVKEILEQENVVIKQYESPLETISEPVEIENKETEEIETKTDHINIIEANTTALKNDKASILSRIANVGHAILPSTHTSPIKKSILASADKKPPMEIFDSTDTSSVISDDSETSATKIAKDLTRNVAIQTRETNHLVNSGIMANNVKPDAQSSFPSLPIDNSQAYASVNENMVQMRKLVPIITNLECGISASEIGTLINKLTHLQGLVKTVEIFETFEKVNNRISSCKDRDLTKPNLEIDTLEQTIREKDDIILNLQNELKIERMEKSNLQKEVNSSAKCFKKMVEDSKQDFIIKDKETKNMIPRIEADLIIATTVKKLMNATFRSLASNFESDNSYSGSNIKSILATVIKKQTVESLSSLLPNSNASNDSSEPTD